MLFVLSNSYTVYLPNYSVGPDCYKAIPEIVARYGKKAVLIGGKTALSKAQDEILAAINGVLEITGVVWYGGNSTYENVEMLMNNKAVQDADMVFAVGGGRAVDTCKTMSAKMDKPIFAFPTIASNCAACTAISVMYKQDGSLADYFYPPHCAEHTFINTKIIAEAPEKLLWAGIGDALSKEYEVLLSSRADKLTHTPLLGKYLSCACTSPLLEYGKQALADCQAKVPSEAIQEIALDIIISTGIVSNLTVSNKYYYNSSLAHCFYNAYTALPQAERHLHGEVVSFGVLVLLTCDEQFAEREKLAKFSKELGLPVTLAEMEITEADVETILDRAPAINEWKKTPYLMTREKFKKAILDMDAYGKSL